MKKCLVLALLTIAGLFTNKSFSQESIQINFQKFSPGDIDLMLKDILVKNGYNVAISYNTDPTLSTKTDYVLSYTAVSRETRDELHQYTLRLSKNGKVINEVSKTIRPLNGVNAPRELCKGLEKLFNKNFNPKQFTYDNEVKYFNIAFQVGKIDDGKYIIVAKGAGVRTLDAVRKAFFAKAKQYLNSFDYFIDSGKYSYSASGGTITTNHTGNMVVGIILRNTAENEINELPSMPDELLQLNSSL